MGFHPKLYRLIFLSPDDGAKVGFIQGDNTIGYFSAGSSEQALLLLVYLFDGFDIAILLIGKSNPRALIQEGLQVAQPFLH